MKIERPHFELTRVYSDGTEETPEIIPVGQMPWDTGMERRGFLGVGIGVAAVLLLVEGKATAASTNGQQQSTSTINQNSNASVKVPSRALNAHKNSVNSVAISPDVKILASGSDDHTIKLWSLPDGKLLATFDGQTLAISRDGKALVSSGDNIRLRSVPDGKLLSTLKELASPNALAISPDGTLLAAGYLGDSIELWSLPQSKHLVTLEGDGFPVRALVISPDGKILTSGSNGNTIRLWSLPNGKLLATLEGHKHSVVALAIGADGKTLASGSRDNTIKLWAFPEGKLLATLEGHNDSVASLAISSDGKTLASGSSDKAIKLWSFPEGKLLAALEGHKHAVNALAISPDGKTLASGDGSGVIILWDLEKRSFLSFLFDPKASQTDAISYNIYDKTTGRTITFTLPCGSAIPPGAVCTCNCVPGTYSPPSPTYSSPSGGSTYCTCNKVCTCIPVPSDRNVKEALATADPMTILQRLAELPIQTWNYNWDDASVRHIGPMAQDFAAAFSVGQDDKHIHPVDAQGVALAAIQALYSLLKDKEENTEKLKGQLQQHREENEALKARVEALESLLRMLS